MTENDPRTIRFLSAEVSDLEDGSCEASVELKHHNGMVFSATARGPGTPEDRLRAVARATSDALSEAFDTKGARVRVVSVQQVQALTKTAVLVTLAVTRGADTATLLGICDATDDHTRAAALAVLSATNRFLGLLGG